MALEPVGSQQTGRDGAGGVAESLHIISFYLQDGGRESKTGTVFLIEIIFFI